MISFSDVPYGYFPLSSYVVFSLITFHQPAKKKKKKKLNCLASVMNTCPYECPPFLEHYVLIISHDINLVQVELTTTTATKTNNDTSKEPPYTYPQITKVMELRPGVENKDIFISYYITISQ